MFILCMYSLLPTNFPIFITGKAAEDGLKLCNLDLKVGFKISLLNGHLKRTGSNPIPVKLTCYVF